MTSQTNIPSAASFNQRMCIIKHFKTPLLVDGNGDGVPDIMMGTPGKLNSAQIYTISGNTTYTTQANIMDKCAIDVLCIADAHHTPDEAVALLGIVDPHHTPDEAVA